MLVQRVKASFRSVRFLYGLLSPSARKVARFRRELLRARQYCMSLPEIVSEPVFVKVGANDGITGDPFSDILLSNVKWTGLLIEPAPNCFDVSKQSSTTPKDSLWNKSLSAPRPRKLLSTTWIRRQLKTYPTCRVGTISSDLSTRIIS